MKLVIETINSQSSVKIKWATGSFSNRFKYNHHLLVIRKTAGLRDFYPDSFFSNPRLCLYLCSHSYCMKAGLLPSSGRWQSSRWWQTTCGPWYHWLHSWGCQSAWSGPLAANFSTDLSGLSWSGKESEPANQEKAIRVLFGVCSQAWGWSFWGKKCLIVTFLT